MPLTSRQRGHRPSRVEPLERRALLSAVISEFLAQNTAVNADEDGTFSDWVEIHNPDPVPLNLAGHYLTDDPDDLAQWQFPAGATIAPGGYLLVWASGKDRRDPNGPLHTNFAMSAAGEYFALVAPNGVQVLTGFTPAFPAQSPNISFGLASDGSYTFFNQPTPAAANAVPDTGAVAAPVVNVERGFYDAPFDLVLQTPTAGATIRYTTDGSAPSPNSGNVYTSPIRIDKTRGIRAIAYRGGGTSVSAIVTHTYIFVEDVVRQPASLPGYPNTQEDVNGGSVPADTAMDPAIVNDPAYSAAIRTGLTSIPTIAITTKITDIFGGNGFYDSETEKGVSVELIDPTHPGNTGQVNAGAEAHSHDRLKRSLRLSFKEEYGPTKWKTDLLNDAPVNGGASADGELDHLVLRAGNNRAWTRLSGPEATTFTEDQWYRDTQIAMSGYGSHGTFVHLYLNGAYWGLYNVAERPDTGWQSRYFGGDAEDYFGTNHDDEREGDDSRWDTLLNTVIKKDMSVRSNYNQLREYLDVDGFADYLILNWFQATTDWPSNNFYVGHQNTPETTGAKFFAWDGEWGWDLGLRTDVDGAWVHPAFRPGSTDSTILAKIWRSAVKSSDFKMLFADRVYKHLGNGGALTAPEITERFDTLNDYVRDAVIAESARWGDALESLDQPTRTRDGDWQRAVNNIRGMMQDNGAQFLDALRDENYYPDLNPATFSQRGGPVVPGFQLVLNNPNNSGTIYYTTDGSDPRANGGGIAASAIAYSGPVTLDASATIRIRVRAGSAWSAGDAADFSVSAFSALRVTELMYNPLPVDGTDGDEFEFVRLQNTGAVALQLAGVKLSGGVDFTFGDVVLPAGGVITLVENPEAFKSRYGATAVVDGKYTEKLDDGGERIKLIDEDGNAILDFEYDDAWYPTTDGGGYSLVIVDPAAAPVAWDNPANWRASTAVGGSPATNGGPQPTNQPPTVSAAGPASATLPSAATVTATMSDDALPAGSATSVTWSLVSGPGTATFANATAASTTVSFSAAGSYVLRATASDGALSATHDITIQAAAQTTEPPPPAQAENSVTRFVIVDPWTGQDVRVLNNGDTINLTEFTKGKVNIRADVGGAAVASVRFGFDKKPGRFKVAARTDSDRPFTLLGDKRGTYKKGTLTVGTHRLIATPFDMAKGRGTAGGAIDITFNVVKGPLQFAASASPVAVASALEHDRSAAQPVASEVLGSAS